MAHDLSIPTPDLVVELLQGYRRSKAMFAGVQLGVFDALSGAACSLEQLNEKLDCHAAALERLLHALAGLGLLEKHDGKFANTQVAENFLTSTSPRRMTGYINYSNAVSWKMWGQLEDAVREGSSRWKQCYGWDEPLFSSFFKTDAAAEEFLMGMHGFGVASSPAVVHALDLSRFRHMVDLGGASGHLAIAACERYPDLKATVFDLTAARGLAERIVGGSPVAERIEIVSGNFFVDPLPAGDLMALGRIVHDWSPDKINLLLNRIREQLPPGGAVMICEKMLWDDKVGPSWAQMQDLNMLVCTEGQERTLGEYEVLLTAAGFVDVVGCRTSTPIDGIMAFKPA